MLFLHVVVLFSIPPGCCSNAAALILWGNHPFNYLHIPFPHDVPAELVVFGAGGFGFLAGESFIVVDFFDAVCQSACIAGIEVIKRLFAVVAPVCVQPRGYNGYLKVNGLISLMV